MNEDELAPMLPIVNDAPQFQRELPGFESIELPRAAVGKTIIITPDPHDVISIPPRISDPAEYLGHKASKPDPWSGVPVDTYWFSRTWARSPGRDEIRAWEFELVTADNRGQQNRLLYRGDGSYELALIKARAAWERELTHDIRALKILVLSS